MHSIRDRLVLIFLAATLVPLGLTFWMTASLLRHSLAYSSTQELDEVSKTLEQTARGYYQHLRETMKADVSAHRIAGEKLHAPYSDEVAEFLESDERERFLTTGDQAGELQLLRRENGGVALYRQKLNGPAMKRIAAQYAHAREVVESGRSRDLQRGFLFTLLTLTTVIWMGGFALLIYFANRISRPVQALTGGLQHVADGNLEARVTSVGTSEVARAIDAFNRMADELQSSRERLVYLARVASWQTLARKMAHEVKNSLTPIRLTMEEINARFDDPFLKQASQIVVDEVGSLERRTRAFSQFAAEPAVNPQAVDVAELAEERVAFLRTTAPGVTYDTRVEEGVVRATADLDLLRGILNNLVANGAHAAGAGGTVRVIVRMEGKAPCVEVHDSGPGLNEEARRTLFEPTISFKKGGMGLGLSIARRSALLMGGDIVLVKGELGGAAFRVTLKPA